VIADIGYFNITIKDNIGTLVATGVNIEELDRNRWNKRWELNSWNVRYTCDNLKLIIIIKPTNGAVTDGTWECEVSQPYYDNCRLDGKNKIKAHIYEENGYLMHEILFNKNSNWRDCDYEDSCSIGCRKTYGKVSCYVSCIKIPRVIKLRVVESIRR
jgi:hypothetical protein